MSKSTVFPVKVSEESLVQASGHHELRSRNKPFRVLTKKIGGGEGEAGAGGGGRAEEGGGVGSA